ncbi:hypothetical protein D3C87_1559100 [compost metagenome]
MKPLGGIVQRSGFGRGIGAVDVQLGTRQLFADQRPKAGFHPEHRVPIGCMAKVADAEKVRPILEGRWRRTRQVDHQRAPMQHVARHRELFHQQLDFHFGNHQVQVATINRGDLPFGQVGLGHELELCTQCRGEQLTEIIGVVTRLQALLEA